VRAHLLDAMTREQFLALGEALGQVSERLDPRGVLTV
jgi:hypothetical protein